MKMYSSPPLRQAQQTAQLLNIWLGTPADGSGTQLFVNQNSAQSFQDADPANQVVASMGISPTDVYSTTSVYAIGDSAYPVSGAPLTPFGL